MKKAVQLVFISYAAGITHLASTMELAKLLVARHDQLYITVLIMKLPFDPKSKPKGSDDSPAPSSVSHRIKLINLPEEAIETQGDNLNIFLKLLVENHKPNVKDVVTKLIEPDPSASKPRLVGFVVDLFCTTMIDVANEFGVPTYIFFASTAGFLGLMFHLQTLYDEENKDSTEFKDSDAELVLPSFVNPLPARSVLPGLFLEKPDATDFLNYARRFRETKGILVNTFMELESHALNSLSDGTIPPVYPVGPLLNLKSDDDHGDSEQAKQKSEILKWLDEQPPLSVVFLCFGSRGSCGENQVKEIAIALEHSGLRFLWSLRQPVPKGQIGLPSDYADPNGVLPEGFLDRTAGIGKMIGLAPQVAILAHPAIGGFVSHCGWNSTLESLWYGVPIATWPMYAEQQLNAFELVRELGLGVEVRMDYRSNSPVVVSAGEIERGIRQVMEHDSDVRRRVKEMSEKGQKALLDGGSSHSSLGRFVDQLFLNLN